MGYRPPIDRAAERIYRKRSIGSRLRGTESMCFAIELVDEELATLEGNEIRLDDH